MTVMTAPALLKFDGPLAIITLNRPASLNAIDIDMAACLERLALNVEQAEHVRVLVIRGAGKSFCAGGDVDFFLAHIDELEPPITRLLSHLNHFLLALRRMDKLVVTSVHGAVAGAGFSMAFMGDFCISASNARFRPAYAQIGLSPDAGGTIGLVSALGARRALQIFLGEPELACTRAEQLGLLAKVVDPQALEAMTLDFAARLANLNPVAVAGTKRLVWQSGMGLLEQQLDAEVQSIIACMATREFKDFLKSLKRR